MIISWQAIQFNGIDEAVLRERCFAAQFLGLYEGSMK